MICFFAFKCEMISGNPGDWGCLWRREVLKAVRVREYFFCGRRTPWTSVVVFLGYFRFLEQML